MSRPARCHACGLTPVSTKTWKLITKQDELLAKQRHEIERLKQRVKGLERKANET